MTWTDLTGWVISLLPLLEQRKERDQARVDEALDALSDAYYSTVSYYEVDDWKSTEQMRREQVALARKWDRVANLTRGFDLGLSSRFSLKSRFWLEGEAWGPEKVAGARIGLESVRKDARFTLISRQQKAK